MRLLQRARWLATRVPALPLLPLQRDAAPRRADGPAGAGGRGGGRQGPGGCVLPLLLALHRAALWRGWLASAGAAGLLRRRGCCAAADLTVQHAARRPGTPVCFALQTSLARAGPPFVGTSCSGECRALCVVFCQLSDVLAPGRPRHPPVVTAPAAMLTAPAAPDPPSAAQACISSSSRRGHRGSSSAAAAASRAASGGGRSGAGRRPTSRPNPLTDRRSPTRMHAGHKGRRLPCLPAVFGHPDCCAAPARWAPHSEANRQLLLWSSTLNGRVTKEPAIFLL